MLLSWPHEWPASTITFLTGIMRVCARLFYKERMGEIWDTNPYLLGFEDGVFDLSPDVCALRPGRPEDFVTKSVGYPCPCDREFNEDHPMVLEFHTFLDRVFPDPELRAYALDYLADLLEGKNKRKTFLVWTGKGDNGKSMMLDLVKYILGGYAVVRSCTILTGRRTQSSQATPELADLAGVRFVALNEPDAKDVINVGMLKEMTGGDAFFARGLFKAGGEVVPMFKMVLLCNVLLGLTGSDAALWNRVRVLTFETRFVDAAECDGLDESEMAARRKFPKDLDLKAKLSDMRYAAMWVLLCHFRRLALHPDTRTRDPDASNPLAISVFSDFDVRRMK